MPHILLKRKPWLWYQMQRPTMIRKVYGLLTQSMPGPSLSWRRKLSCLWQSIRLTRYVPYHQHE
jgi:hypothetical protein